LSSGDYINWNSGFARKQNPVLGADQRTGGLVMLHLSDEARFDDRGEDNADDPMGRRQRQ